MRLRRTTSIQWILLSLLVLGNLGCSVNASITGLNSASESISPSLTPTPGPKTDVPVTAPVPSSISVVGDSGLNSFPDVFNNKQIDSGESLVSVSLVTAPSNGTFTLVGMVPTYTPNAGFVGKDTFTYTAVGDKGTNSTRTITIEVRRAHTWSGAGSDKLWSNSANWIGGLPAASDLAYFEDACTQCDVTLDGAQSILGIVTSNLFTGVISFDNQTSLLAVLTIGNSGVQFAAGKIELGQGKLLSSGDVNFTGGVINGQSGLFVSLKNFSIAAGVNFSSQSSTFEFTGANTGGTLTFPSSARFKNVSFTHDSTSKNISGTLVVDGTLSFNVTFVSINGGTIESYGNIEATKINSGGHTTLIKVLGSANQLLTGTINGCLPNIEIAKTGGTLTVSGILSVAKNFTYTSGTVDFNSSGYGPAKAVFTTPAGGTISLANGIGFQNVDFTHDSSSKTLTGTMNIVGDLLFDVTFVSVTGGIIKAYGNVTATKMTSSGNAMVLKIVGTANQLISGTTNGVIPNLEIAKTGGTAVFTGGMAIAKNFTYTSGTVDFNNITAGRATTRFTGANTAGTISASGVQFGNVIIDHDSTGKTLAANMTVKGDLTVSTIFVWVTGFQIAVEGNLSITSTGSGSAGVGNTEIILTGSLNQTVAHNTGYKFPGKKFTISKSSGQVNLSTAVSLSTSQNLDITTGGSVNLNNFVFDGNGTFNCFSGTVNRGTGTLWISGTTSTNACTIN